MTGSLIRHEFRAKPEDLPVITVDGMPERPMWNIFTHLARLVAYPVIRRQLGINGWEGDSG